jgi:hypothetical protein
VRYSQALISPLKTQRIARDVEQLAFKRLTLVLGEQDGRKFQPVNSDAEIVAVKARAAEIGISPQTLLRLRGQWG